MSTRRRRPPRRDLAIYWTTTALVCAVMAFSAVNFSLKHPLGPAANWAEGPFPHLGLPNWFKVELIVAKALGVLALLLPWVPTRARDFAYAGFAIILTSASIAHLSSGDPIGFALDPLVFLGLLATSYVYARRLERADAPPPADDVIHSSEQSRA